MAHCWMGRAEHEEAAGRSWDGPGQTCMLDDGHAGPHEWTGDDGIVVEFPPSAERVAALVEERDAAVTRAEAAERERDIAIAGGAARIEGAAARIDAIAREGNPYGESLVDDDDPLRMTRWQGWDDGWLGAHIEDERDRLRAERAAAVLDRDTARRQRQPAPVAGEGEEAGR